MYSPNVSSRQGMPIRLIVVHGDAGRSDEGTVSWILNPKSRVSYHYLVGRQGTVTQLVRDEDKAWHAGKSTWPACSHLGSVNHMSLGVAFANDGTGGEEYGEAQLKAGADLVARLCHKYELSPTYDVARHSDVSPGRKTDPWSWFPWDWFIEDIDGRVVV